MSTEQTIQLLRETLKGVLQLADVEIRWGSKAWAKAAADINKVLDETQHTREQHNEETGMKDLRHCEECYSDADIEQLMNQEPLPEGWTEFSQNEPAGDKLARTQEEERNV